MSAGPGLDYESRATGLDRNGVGRIVRRVARKAGLAKKIGPHTRRHAFITAALDAACGPRKREPVPAGLRHQMQRIDVRF